MSVCVCVCVCVGKVSIFFYNFTHVCTQKEHNFLVSFLSH